jgi:hypothetical protein
MMALRLTVLCVAGVGMVGCPGQFATERNPFLVATENFGTSIFRDDEEDRAGAGATAEAEFRRTLSLTLANWDADGELNTSWVAWVSPSSIRSADQQDALLSNGYVQLTRTVQLGTVFTLTPGTFVYNGSGFAGATVVRVDYATPGDSDTDPVTPTEVTFPDLITPDVLLVFSQPPVSCDTPAFFFTLDGLPLDLTPEQDSLGAEFGGATGRGAVKTLAQFDAYQCSPLRPGLFFRPGGGAREDNEFFEGQDIRIDFTRVALGAEDLAAFVTVGDRPSGFAGVDAEGRSGGAGQEQEPGDEEQQEPGEEGQEQTEEGQEEPP